MAHAPNTIPALYEEYRKETLAAKLHSQFDLFKFLDIYNNSISYYNSYGLPKTLQHKLRNSSEANYHSLSSHALHEQAYEALQADSVSQAQKTQPDQNNMRPKSSQEKKQQQISRTDEFAHKLTKAHPLTVITSQSKLSNQQINPTHWSKQAKQSKPLGVNASLKDSVKPKAVPIEGTQNAENKGNQWSSKLGGYKRSASQHNAKQTVVAKIRRVPNFTSSKLQQKWK